MGLHQISRLAQPAIWALLLLGTLAFGTWAYFAHSGPVPLSAEAELSDQLATAITWRTGQSSERFKPSTMHPAQITARRFSIYVWNGTRFLLDIFASAPMEACTAGLQIADEIHLTAHDPITLTLEDDNGAAPWRTLDYGGSTFLLTATAMAKENSDAGRSNSFHGLVWIKGNGGGRFKISVKSADGSPSCAGTFADFKGSIYPTRPASYEGPGKEGINRITLDAPGGVRRFDSLGFQVLGSHQGIAIFAADATDFADQDYVEAILLSPKSGTLNFGRQFNVPLVPNVWLDIIFAESGLGRFNLTSHLSGRREAPVMKVAGTASDTYLGDENLTPRRLEGFPWWVQTMIGLIIAFCSERLYGSVRSAVQARGTPGPKPRKVETLGGEES
jgi:hypothetical protein